MIKLGQVSGHHFYGQADLVVARHVEQIVNGCVIRKGHFCTRKRLVDHAAFNYDPAMGWEIDRWFEWDDEKCMT